MKKANLLCCSLLISVLPWFCYASENKLPSLVYPPKSVSQGFFTPFDIIAKDSNSGLVIRNVTGSSITLNGLFVRAKFTDGNCGSYTDYGKTAALMIAVPGVTVAPSGNVNVGANFLYNLMHLYMLQNNVSTFPTNCFEIDATSTTLSTGAYNESVNSCSGAAFVLTCTPSTATCTANGGAQMTLFTSTCT